jgi:ABC-type branched-subunit amino acid transport system ATPase component
VVKTLASAIKYQLGANGAGKSTTLNSIIGLIKPESGKIIWDGEDITAKDPKYIVSRSLVLIPEGRHIFPISKMIFEIIQEINRAGTTILLIEQNAHAALEIANYAYVLETGVITMQNTGEALLKDDSIRRAYLGEGQ